MHMCVPQLSQCGQPPRCVQGLIESINVQSRNHVIIIWIHLPLQSEGLTLLLRKRKLGRDRIKNSRSPTMNHLHPSKNPMRFILCLILQLG